MEVPFDYGVNDTIFTQLGDISYIISGCDDGGLYIYNYQK
jgi:hypothetical protein